MRPLDEVSTFLAGARPVRWCQPPITKTIEVSVEVPVPDLAALDERPAPGSTDEEVIGSAAGTAQRPSIWPAVERRLLALVREHRSTIVFANSRRLAERLTARLNELAAEEVGRRSRSSTRSRPRPSGSPGSGAAAPATVAKAHHGSMSREQRTLVEEELKGGLLPCVVATSSLELGIDMGAVDLVVQVEAPPSVASGLQRVGRAGHQVGAVSTGVVFPKYRGDLVSCAVVAERMTAGAIESMRYPRNPLDVLAQQIVAMLALEPWALDDLARVVRRAAPFAALPDSALHSVLDMLAGRYPSEEFGELRARITWDRVTDQLAGRPGAQRLAVTSGGTIPDRGLFTVMTPGGADGAGSRVGELDEEMVYESRVGDTFLLGTSSWRVEDITHDRVIVTPAPGQPARMPFWKGESIGRPLELGRAVGAFVREMSGLTDEAARDRARAAGLDEWATDNLLAYLHEQRDATRHVPSDRTILVERFRDELGDWRLVVHSPFGSQVNGPWGLAIAARMRERRGVEVHAAAADDGIVLRLPDAVDESGSEVVPTAEDVLLDPGEVEQIVVAELGSSSLYASRFRECAARALLLPRRDPKRRSPLWQQRQRSAQLLAVAGRYEQFPITLEAMRECVQDVYDLPGLRELMSDVAARKVQVVELATPAPSPFARSLLFGYVGMFLYESDAPLAERRAAALSLDSTLLAELLGSEAIRELLDPEVLAEIEASLQRLAPDRHARDAEGAADLLRFLGDLTTAEAAARGVRPEWLDALQAARRAIRVRIGGEERWLAIEDAGRVRDALGAALPVGVPEAFTEPVPDPLGDLVLRYARTHGPFAAAECAARFGLGVAVVVGVLDRLVGAGRLVRGELRPLGHGASGGPRARRRRVLRRRGAAPAAPGLAGPVAGRGGAGRATRAGPVPARLAGGADGGRGRAPGPDASRTRSRGRARGGGAAGRGAVAGQRAGVADPARPAARLHPGAARRADRGRRGHLDRLRAAGRHRRLAGGGPGRRGRPAAARPGARRGGDPAAPGAARRAGLARPRGRTGGRWGAVLPRAGRPGRARADRRGRAGPGRRRRGHRDLGPGLGRAAQQRHAGPAAGPAGRADRGRRRGAPDRAAPHRAAATRSCGPAGRRCPAAAGRRRSAGGGRWPRSASPTRPGGRTPGRRRCWNGTGCSPGARWAPNGSPVGSPGCTGCCAPWRTPAGRAAATSWRGSARPSSRCPGRSTGCARCPARTAPRPAPTSWPAPVGRSNRRARQLRRHGAAAPLRPAPTGSAGLGPGGAGRRRPGPALRRRAELAGHRRRHQAPTGAQGRRAGGAGRGGAGAVRRARRPVAAVVHRRAGRADRRRAGAGRGRARGLAGDAGRGARGRGRLAGVGAGRGADRGRVPGDAEGAATAGVAGSARRGQRRARR